MQKLQLSIPEPCHENWQQMIATDQGRFCNACAKEVVDLSMMTDIQVLNYFSTLTHEKVCGRALPEQLNKTISRPITPKKKLFWYWNYIVMFFMFFGKGNAAKAQGGIKPVTECSPVKTNGIRGEIAAVGGVKRESSRIISGKVTDKDGNPVSFASIKIKGTPTGVSADANGGYSIRANSNDLLVISGASFKTVEVPVSNQSVVNTVLLVGMTGQMEVLVSGVFGGMVSSSMDYSAPDKTKAVAILNVKDEETGKYLPNVSVIINVNSVSDTVYTDRKGMYKIKNIKEYEHYFIRVLADGYEANEFTINSYDFKDRKKEWEVLLRKQKIESVKVSGIAISKTEKPIRLMGSFSVVNKDKGPIYVVDGTIIPKGADINPDDIDTYELLQGPQAMALFGSAGSGGAIVITTRMAKEKRLDTVTVTAYPIQGKMMRTVCTSSAATVMGGMVKGVTIKNTFNDSLKIMLTKITGAIKIYPNPVERGNTFNLSLKLKQTGLYQIQITDAAGRTVLQKQIHTVSKDFTEKIMADNRWSSGVYYISLIDNKNKLVNKSSFILQ